MALTKARAVKFVRASNLELPAKNEAVWKGGIACWDTSTGLVAKGFASTTLIPIGTYAEDREAVASGTVLVNLFREINAVWMPNAGGGDAVVAADLGGLAYLADDNTVQNNDATNTLSVFGRIWKLDSTKGVLVEPMDTAGQRTVSGLD